MKCCRVQHEVACLIIPAFERLKHKEFISRQSWDAIFLVFCNIIKLKFVKCIFHLTIVINQKQVIQLYTVHRAYSSIMSCLSLPSIPLLLVIFVPLSYSASVLLSWISINHSYNKQEKMYHIHFPEPGSIHLKIIPSCTYFPKNNTSLIFMAEKYFVSLSIPLLLDTQNESLT